MTTVSFKLSPRAVSALQQYTEMTGLGVDAAADELILAASLQHGVQPEQREQQTSVLTEKQRRFLAHFRELQIVSLACQATGISEGLPYGWARTNIHFAQAFDAARAEVRDKLRWVSNE